MTRYFFFLLLILFTVIELHGQSPGAKTNATKSYRIMFYNVENFFDAEIDTSRSYNEFTPEGNLHWTHRKVDAKRKAVYKVITALGQWSSPAIIGMVEVENKSVLTELIDKTPLKQKGYQVIHFDSPDFRGIDAALLYSPDFRLISAKPVRITDPDDPEFTTRDMLYAKGILGNDTLHVIVNHWTSRYRGLLESSPKRLLQARALLHLTDSICQVHPNANIVAMGDFNDSPDNESMKLLVRDGGVGKLVNLHMQTNNSAVKGTLKFQGQWDIFDQMLVTENMLHASNSLWVVDSVGHIFSEPFVLEDDEKFGGVKPNRTNVGFTYHGGYSDHLPVFLDIITTP